MQDALQINLSNPAFHFQQLPQKAPSYEPNVQADDIVSFYFSNNTNQCTTLSSAYLHMLGSQQKRLRSMINYFMHDYDIPCYKIQNATGIYTSVHQKKGVADNTLILSVPRNQLYLPYEANSIAQELANLFEQETIAVFVTNNQLPFSKIKVEFTTLDVSINNLYKLLRKLPARYASTFTVYIKPNHNQMISSIEWLGSYLDLNEIEMAFPDQQICLSRGDSWVVGRNGTVVKL
jgi:hypothetical protein